MDLTKAFPRSPREKMSGLVHVYRMIDKARAHNHKTLGEYIYPCPLDDYVLDFLNIQAEGFAKMAETHTEEEISKWVEHSCRGRTDEEKEAINRKIMDQKPETKKGRKKFKNILNQLAPLRTDIDTWVALIDLEEGRSGPG